MWAGLELLFDNTGLPFEAVVLIIVFLGGLMFIAKDFRLGLIYYFVSGSGCFLWFYRLAELGNNINWSYGVVFMLLALAFMALNLFSVKDNSGVVV